MDAYHATHPSPQRTPVIFQAGASKAGMAFAGKHAEALFVAGPNPTVVKKQVQTVRAEADAQGRDGSKIKFFVGILPVIGKTVEEAQAKYKQALKDAHAVGGMARFSGFTNLDLSQYPPDEPFAFKGEQSEASIHGTINNIKAVLGLNDDEPWTPRRLGAQMSFGGTGSTPVGTPAMIADVFEMWMREAEIDGFNVMRKPFLHTPLARKQANLETEYLSPTSYEDVVELLVPELQRRGIYWNDYAVPGGTLRENMFAEKGASSVGADHPAHQFKWSVRETNWPSAWDLRRNKLEASQRASGESNGVEKPLEKAEVKESIVVVNGSS
jgi:Luciferase-like monooxygenase